MFKKLSFSLIFAFLPIILVQAQDSEIPSLAAKKLTTPSAAKMLEAIDNEAQRFNDERLKITVEAAYKAHPKNNAIVRSFILYKLAVKEPIAAGKALDNYLKLPLKSDDSLENAWREHIQGVVSLATDNTAKSLKHFEKVQQLYSKIYAPDSSEFTHLQLENYYWHHRALRLDNKQTQANEILKEAAGYVSSLVNDGKVKQLPTLRAFELLYAYTLNQLAAMNVTGAESYGKNLAEIVKVQHERYKNNVHNQDLVIKNRIIQGRIAAAKNSAAGGGGGTPFETDVAALEIKRYLENSNYSDKAKALKITYELNTFRFNNFSLTNTQFLEKAEEVVKFANDLYEKDKSTTQRQVDMLLAHNFLGSAHVRAQDNAQIVKTYQHVLNISTDLLKNAKLNSDFLQLTVPRREAYNALAEHYARRNEQDTVIHFLSISREELKELLDKNPEDKGLDFQYRALFRRISAAFVMQKAYKEAIAEYDQLIEMDRKLAEKDSKNQAPLTAMIGSANQIATIYANANLTSEAIEQYQKNIILATGAYEKFKNTFLAINIYNQLISLDKNNAVQHMQSLLEFYERMDKDGNMNQVQRTQMQQLRDRIKNMKT